MSEVALAANIVAGASPSGRRRRMPLAVKLAAALVGLVVLVLLVNGAINMWLSYGQAKSAALDVQQEKAQAAAERVGEFIAEIEGQIGWTTRVEWSRVPLEQQRYDFIRLLRQVSAITELSYLDGQGKEQLKVSRLEPDSVGSGRDFSEDPRFAKAVADKFWFGPIYFRRGSEPYMTISIAHAGHNTGVTVAEVNLKLIWDVISAIRVGEKGYAFVVDGKGRLIAHPDLSLVLRDTDLSRLPQVKQALAEQASVEPGAPTASSTQADKAEVATGFEGGSVLTAHSGVPRVNWIVFVQLPLAEALAPVYASLFQTLALLGLGLLLALVLGGFLARRLVVPIRRLQEGAERLGGGDLSQRIDIRTGDEIETLANRFNRMAERVQESHETLEAKVEARTHDLNEALQQQTATADVLKVISRSAFDLQPVLDTLVTSARNLSGADRSALLLLEGEFLVLRASLGNSPEWIEWRKANPQKLGRGVPSSRAALLGSIVHIPDVLEDPEFAFHASRKLADYRASLSVPLMREGQAIGVLTLTRIEPGLFTDRRVELVQTFADQAVIAIENARLFDEVQAKTRDLTEALQQQTATADVLKVISRSAFDLDAVMNTLTRSAAELCDAEIGSLHLREGDVLVARGISNSDPKAAAYLRDTPVPINEHTNVGRSVLHGSISNIADYKVGEGLRSQAYQDVIGFRSFLCVPLMRDGRGVGVFSLGRRRVAQFSQRQIELLQTFADQAVIAIENARLFEEVQAKTRDLTEALQQQTATADVLKVISRSAFDLQPVLDTLVASAARLCDGYAGAVYLREGELFHAKAVYGGGPMFLQFLMEHPMKAGRQSMAPRVILSGKLEQIPDALLDPEFVFPGLQRNNPARAFIGVPLLRDGRLEGVFILTRNAPGLFSESEVNLLQTFADQAVIAIENVRLFEQVQAKTRDLTEALEQQTATADVLKVISRSTFDLQTVLDTLVGSAARLCEAEKACIFQREGELYRWVSNFGFPDELVQYAQAHPFAAGPNSTTGRVALEGKPIQVADVLADPDYTASEYQRLGNYRTNLGVPLLREGVPIGVFVMTRQEVRPFNDRQVELLQTFADQAVIAIENVRLFEETQARTKELAQSIEELRAAQDRLIQSEKLASLGQLTAGIAHEIKNPLNFVNNFAALSRELIEELRPLVAGAGADAKAKDEIEELMQLLGGNLEKVTQHGKRADSIVKNMLLHSRESSGEHRFVDLNALVEESVNLAYHGARAEKPGFNITLVKSLDPAVGEVDLYPQEFTRVLLNLISNGFYAATKRKAEGAESFEPALTAATRDLGDKVEIKIRDNGTGIPDEVKAKMFNPFFTTKPAGEGTGLGLSLSHDIIAKQHGGTIAVETEPGAFTEFTIVIPRGGNPATPSARG